jgi:hypothetical protein
MSPIMASHFVLPSFFYSAAWNTESERERERERKGNPNPFPCCSIESGSQSGLFPQTVRSRKQLLVFCNFPISIPHGTYFSRATDRHRGGDGVELVRCCLHKVMATYVLIHSSKSVQETDEHKTYETTLRFHSVIPIFVRVRMIPVFGCVPK